MIHHNMKGFLFMTVRELITKLLAECSNLDEEVAFSVIKNDDNREKYRQYGQRFHDRVENIKKDNDFRMTYCIEVR